jgi:signal transduction histidine kinase
MIITGYVTIFILVIFIAWLSNREINKSLTQPARKSEKLLADERDALGRIVTTRTKELIASEQMRTAELEKSAEFGELSQGLFHDLMNPLSSLALYIENMATKENRPEKAKEMIEKAVIASRRMESFMNSIKHTTAKAVKTTDCSADLIQELATVRDLLAYKARMAGVKIVIEKINAVFMRIHPIRLHQLLLNLISNAVDACAVQSMRCGQDRFEGLVKISTIQDGQELKIIIADNGCGIPANKIKEVFNHPFTTKPEGTGIGLITVKKIVEEELQGKISMISQENKGATFAITIPY